MKTLGGIILIFFLTGILSCKTNKPIARVSPGNNKSFKVDYLFEHDGCKVYRFNDNGHWVYFTNCNGEAITIKNDSTKTQITNTIKVESKN